MHILGVSKRGGQLSYTHPPPHTHIHTSSSTDRQAQPAITTEAHSSSSKCQHHVSQNFLLVVVKPLASSKLPITMLTAEGSHLQPGCLLVTSFWARHARKQSSQFTLSFPPFINTTAYKIRVRVLVEISQTVTWSHINGHFCLPLHVAGPWQNYYLRAKLFTSPQDCCLLTETHKW